MDPYELAHQVDRIRRKIEADLHPRMPAIDHAGIGQLGSMTLMVIAEIEPASINRVVEEMARDKSQMTRTIKRLEQLGMVRRVRSAQDARMRVLSLTPTGHTYVDHVRELLAQVVLQLLSPLTEAERDQFVATLRKL